MYRMKYFLFAFLLVGSLAISNTIAETLLYQNTVSVNRSVNNFSTNQFDVDLVFGDHQFIPTNDIALFDGLTITPSDVGSIYEATTSTDVNFATASTRVTDALNEFITVAMTENFSGGLTEQRIAQENQFFQQAIPVNPPDLSGNVVDKVRLEVDSFTFAPPNSAVEGQPVDLVLTISFLGQIPEPHSLALLGLGLTTYLGLYSIRIRRD